jgi:hypothetical protein
MVPEYHAKSLDSENVRFHTSTLARHMPYNSYTKCIAIMEINRLRQSKVPYRCFPTC